MSFFQKDDSQAKTKASVLRTDFVEEFGISPEDAVRLFADQSLMDMLCTLESSITSALVEEPDADNRLREQGQSRLLRAMIAIPDRVGEIESCE